MDPGGADDTGADGINGGADCESGVNGEWQIGLGRGRKSRGVVKRRAGTVKEKGQGRCPCGVGRSSVNISGNE